MAQDEIVDYFWTFSEIADCLNINCKEKKKRSSKSYSESFSNICKTFGLNEMFRYYESEESQKGQYIFPKCLACKITFAVNKLKEEIPDMEDMAKEEVKTKTLEKINKTERLLSASITDDHFEEYISKNCPMVNSMARNSENCCDLFLKSKCVPDLISKLFYKYTQYCGRKNVFSSVELSELCGVLISIYSVNDNRKKYKEVIDVRVNERRDVINKVGTNAIWSLDAAVMNGNMRDYLGAKRKMEQVFREFYVNQWRDENKAKVLYLKLSGFKDLKNKSWKPGVLVMHMECWKEKWLYIFRRFSDLRRKESVIKIKEKTPNTEIRFDRIFKIVIWEVSYINFTEREMVKIYKEIEEESPIDENMVDICEDNRKIREYGYKYIGEFLVNSEEIQKELNEDDAKKLYEEAFYDLERVIGYISIGWKNPKSNEVYYRNIINELRESDK